MSKCSNPPLIWWHYIYTKPNVLSFPLPKTPQNIESAKFRLYTYRKVVWDILVFAQTPNYHSCYTVYDHKKSSLFSEKRYSPTSLIWLAMCKPRPTSDVNDQKVSGDYHLSISRFSHALDGPVNRTTAVQCILYCPMYI